MRFICCLLGLGLFTASTLASEAWPEWTQNISPYARFRLRWLERYESGRDESTPQILLQLGITPRFREYFRTGFEISTGETAVVGATDSANLSGGLTSKSLGLRQAYLALKFNPPISVEFIAGKYLIPISSSPLIWFHQIPPEGFSQIFETSFAKDWKLKFSTHQWSLDQVQASSTAGTPHRRSWVFVESVGLESSWAEVNRAGIAVQQFYFRDLAEEISRTSGQLGNTTLSASQLRYRYAPIEVVMELSGQPLGIASGVRSAVAMNFRTPDKQRGFWAEGHVGNTWLARHMLASLSYIYSEPDLSVGAFSDRDYGSSNRKGVLSELSYYIWDEWRIGATFLFVETLAQSSSQSTRKEFKIDTELKF